jgi:hypothetical protein
MAVYRFFEIGGDDPIHQSPSMMDCPDDETAVRRAEPLAIASWRYGIVHDSS